MSYHEQTLADWLTQEAFTLGLSSGFFGFYAHAGFVAALHEAGIKPASYSGSSAGALIAACFASGLSPAEVKDRLLQLTREQFWDPSPGLGLLRGRLFKTQLKRFLPVRHIEDCKVPLSISTYSPLGRRTVVFRKGDLIDTLYASCAVPFLFQPVWIKRKPYWDGGIADRAGVQGVEPGARLLYHHLLSQSWWRKPQSLSMQLPKRENMMTVGIENLPRVNPYQLHLGPYAYETAYIQTKKALKQPISAENELWLG